MQASFESMVEKSKGRLKIVSDGLDSMFARLFAHGMANQFFGAGQGIFHFGIADVAAAD